MENTTEAVVTKMTGSLVSDNVVNKVDKMVEMSAEIGRLQGENSKLLADLDRLELELDNKDKKVTVILKDNLTTNAKYDPWNGSLRIIENSHLHKVETVNVDDLQLLANATIKAEANERVKQAEDKANEAKKESKESKEILKKYKEQSEKERKNLQKNIDEAVERAEKTNLRKINSLENEIKIKDKNAELAKIDLENMILERDIIVEEMENTINILNERIRLLSEKPSSLVNKALAYIKDYWYTKKLKRNLYA